MYLLVSAQGSTGGIRQETTKLVPVGGEAVGGQRAWTVLEGQRKWNSAMHDFLYQNHDYIIQNKEATSTTTKRDPKQNGASKQREEKSLTRKSGGSIQRRERRDTSWPAS